MKKTLALLALVGLTCWSAAAQTNSPGPLPPFTASIIAAPNTDQVPNMITNPFTPFYSQVYDWTTSYNTNLYWTNEVTFSTGIATTTGQKVADRIKLGKNVGNWHFGGEADFIGVGSPIDKMEADLGYALVNKYDFQLGGELGAGYDFKATDARGAEGAAIVDPKLFARKKFSPTWYAEVTYGQPVRTVGKFSALGEIYAGAGFTF